MDLREGPHLWESALVESIGGHMAPVHTATYLQGRNVQLPIKADQGAALSFSPIYIQLRERQGEAGHVTKAIFAETIALLPWAQ